MEKDDWPWQEILSKQATYTDSFILRDLRFLEGCRALLDEVLPSYAKFMFTARVIYFLFYA